MSLKIWFDVLTPKQVMFFKPIVDSLQKSGHEVLCTSRNYKEAVEMARMKRLDISIVGRHGGSDRYHKLYESSKRTVLLAKVVNDFAPNVAVSFASPEASRVAFGLGIKLIGINDSPHAQAVAKLTVPFLSRLLCPWIIPAHSWTKFGISKEQVFHYEALDPAAWLKHREQDSTSSLGKILGKKAIIDPGKKTIVLRLEETKASYIADSRFESRLNIVDELVKRFWRKTNMIILCRYKDQIEQVSEQFNGKASVPKSVVESVPLISLSDVFIGAGGTMTAEAALIGKPAISIAPMGFAVERYLVNSGLVKKPQDRESLIALVEKILTSRQYAERQKSKARRLLDWMEDPADKIISAIKDSVRL